MPEIAELELLVLLAVLHCGATAYSVAVHAELERRSGRSASIGAIYVTLERLEAKGFLTSRLGEPTAERGGRAKRYFSVTAAGMSTLKDECRVIRRMWAGLGLLAD
jgi:PadR family transcriptional regulator, regulatory protein PadR